MHKRLSSNCHIKLLLSAFLWTPWPNGGMSEALPGHKTRQELLVFPWDHASQTHKNINLMVEVTIRAKNFLRFVYLERMHGVLLNILSIFLQNLTFCVTWCDEIYQYPRLCHCKIYRILSMFPVWCNLSIMDWCIMEVQWLINRTWA